MTEARFLLPFPRRTNRLVRRSMVFLALAFFMVASRFAVLAQSSPSGPAAIENAWQKAESKYDDARQEILKDVERQANEGPFHPDWESLQNYRAPAWYEDAKFGIFIHWGLYSVPAFANEWYSRNMYQPGSAEFRHHVATYGPQSKFGYKDFIPMFRAERFDARAWARLFREAGAKYVVPVAEHHDGFPMYDSRLTDWCAGKMGPKRDLFGELATAVRAEGLHLGASSHRAEHDWFFDGGRQFDSDVNDPRYAAFYGPAHLRLVKPGYEDRVFEDWTLVSPDFLDDWLARTAEIVENYHPDLIYFDWWINQPSFRKSLAEFAAFYYNQGAQRGTGAVINYKYDAFEEHSATLDVERGQLSDIRPMHWQTDTSISNASWGYVEGDTFKSPEFIVHLLADVVSKNGNLLLNIGPRPDGTIPEPVQQILRDVGAWLAVNGEAIYGTRPWMRYGEGPTVVEGGAFHEKDAKPYTAEDFRFTTKGDNLYAIELGWPRDGKVTIRSLGKDALKGQKIQSIVLLGSEGKTKIEWRGQADGVHVQLPPQAVGKYAYVLRVALQRETSTADAKQ
ncbi:MAG: alpha-L-fucosidase [Candidatus Sulfotelmatobacter sp.]|jgi:alpha-L-fucosidase